MEDFFSFRTLIIRALMLRDRVVWGPKQKIGAAVRKANEIPQRAKWCGVNRFNVFSRPAHYVNPRRSNANTSVRKHTGTTENCATPQNDTREGSLSSPRNGSVTQENRIHRNFSSAAHPTDELFVEERDLRAIEFFGVRAHIKLLATVPK
jgi:hypothetical protein